jgi:arylsulfate sulfotransferase
VQPQAGQTPQPGIELFDTLVPYEPAQAFATDLSGNVLWTYSYQGPTADVVQPIKVLPNGHFLVQISYASSQTLANPNLPIGKIDEVREVDLAGNTIRSVTQAQVAKALTAEGYTFQLGSLHHDVLALPNGHWVLLFSVVKTFDTLQGETGPTTVLGDALVDVDTNGNPDWVWNAFDHLDINRRPYLFPDWTHSNSLLYSADDGNLLLSVRHQNWVLKIDFADGKGSGDILWRLGEGGDFSLEGGVDPTDWFYAQHGLSYFTTNTTGTFELGIMDNGDDRIFPAGVTCGVGSAPPCEYSTITVMQVDENAKTAKLVVHDESNYGIYSFFAGNVAPLANGQLEVDFGGVKSGSIIEDLNESVQPATVVWYARTPQTYQFRTARLGSLYPGVQW